MAEEHRSLSSGHIRSAAEEDRRVAGRQRRSVKVAWRLLGEQEDQLTSGEVYDLSRTGLALRLDTPLRVASILMVKLVDVHGWTGEPFLVRIKHVNPLEEGVWVAGCSLTRKFTEDEFQFLMLYTSDQVPLTPDQPKRPCGRREHRDSNRLSSEKWLSVRIKPMNLLRPEGLGRLRDRSKGGLGLVSLIAFPPGTILNVRLEQTEMAPWVQVRVKHCRPHERQWILGCQFTEKPTPSALAQFG